MILPRKAWRRQAARPEEYHILAFDPGGIIGWAHLVLDYRAFSRPENKALRWLASWDVGELAGTELDQLNAASQMIYNTHFPNEFNQRLDVISEDFELTQLIGGKNLLSPVRINAVLEWECVRQGLSLTLQRRVLRIGQTADRLNAFGFQGPSWRATGAGKDAFAAMQHAVTWLRRIKEESRRLPWKLVDTMGGRYWDCRCDTWTKKNGSRNGSTLCDLRHPR